MTKIIGIGNPLMGDDGVGIAVIERLQALSLPPGVEVIDGGTGGVTLLHLIEGADRVFFVDAVDMDRPPGTIAVFAAAQILSRESPNLSLHETGLPQVLALGRELGPLPEITLYGVQPQSVARSIALSPAVKAAVPSLVERIVRDLSRGPA